MDSDTVYFLRNQLSLKTEQIQTVVPLIKTAAKMAMDSKDNKSKNKEIPNDEMMVGGDRGRGYSVNTKRNTMSNKQAITPFNVWLPRNVLYSKQRLTQYGIVTLAFKWPRRVQSSEEELSHCVHGVHASADCININSCIAFAGS